MIRALLLTAGLIVAAIGPVALFLGIFIVYSLRYTAYEFLALAAMVDAFYGVHTLLPVYTILCAVWLIGLQWLKPRLAVYNQE